VNEADSCQLSAISDQLSAFSKDLERVKINLKFSGDANASATAGFLSLKADS
jgi:hypothetical protein